MVKDTTIAWTMTSSFVKPLHKLYCFLFLVSAQKGGNVLKVQKSYSSIRKMVIEGNTRHISD